MKNCKKLLSLLVVLSIIFLTLFLTSVQAAIKNGSKAEELNTMGLFVGTNNGFELDKSFTREQSVIMALRLRGLESEAESANLSSTFSDIANSRWSAKYIEYAKVKGITSGIGNNKFGPELKVTAREYITLALRALSYNDKTGDFKWDQPFSCATSSGLLSKTETADYSSRATAAILRDDVVGISYNALKTKLKGSSKTLLQNLVDAGVVLKYQVNNTKDQVLIAAAGDSLKMYNDGVYTGVAKGHENGLTVQVTVKDDKIIDVKVISNNDTPYYFGQANKVIPQKIISDQSTSVDVVSGASQSSRGIMRAVDNALSKALR